MAEFHNQTLVYPKTFTNFKSGILLNGLFWNDTVFDGPGLLKFACPESLSCTYQVFAALGPAVFVVFGIGLMLGSCIGIEGEKRIARRIAGCKNEQERLYYLNSLLGNDEQMAFKTWTSFWTGGKELIKAKKSPDTTSVDGSTGTTLRGSVDDVEQGNREGNNLGPDSQETQVGLYYNFATRK